jgi:hypothetical protein
MRPSHRKLGAALPLLLLALGARIGAGQAYPPAQGPLLAEEPYRTIPTFLLINSVKTAIQTSLDSVNASISREADSTGIQAHVSFSATTYQPAMSVTQYPDKPNENVVRMPFMVTYDVSGIRYHGLPYFSRQIGQSIELVMSCDRWFTNNGQMRVTARADRPYLDGTSFGEDVLNFFIAHTLTDLVDSKLRQSLPGATTAGTDSLGACNRLGVIPGTAPNYTDGSINFKKTFVPVRLPTVYDASVTFQKIKRLPARTIGGAVLYNDVEDVQLRFYANQDLRTAHLENLREGDERDLTMPTVALGPLGGTSSLVLILNIEQLTSLERDTRFSVFTRESNFGNGTQKIIVRKSYWEPPQRLPDGRLTKPLRHDVDAYEITALVSAPQPLLTEGGPAATTAPGVGTRALELSQP